MCDFSGRLIAWMDGELPANEAEEVERHVRDCSECRERVDAYEQVSRAFAAYCDAATEAKGHRHLPPWVPVLSSAAAAAVVLLVVFQTSFFRPALVKTISVRPQVVDSTPVVVHEIRPRPVEKVHPRHLTATRKTPKASWVSAEPAIQIAIPAEAMFPPGAVPEGTTFIADLRMAADGSLQGLRLR